MIREETAIVLDGANATAFLSLERGIRLIPHDPRPGTVWLNKIEAVEFAQAILRAYDVTAKQAV